MNDIVNLRFGTQTKNQEIIQRINSQKFRMKQAIEQDRSREVKTINVYESKSFTWTKLNTKYKNLLTRCKQVKVLITIVQDTFSTVTRPYTTTHLYNAYNFRSFDGNIDCFSKPHNNKKHQYYYLIENIDRLKKEILTVESKIPILDKNK